MADQPNPNTEKVETQPQAAVQSDAPVNPPQQPPAEPAEDVFDKDRAMNTIKNLREQEKKYKQELKELEQLKAAQKQREEAELSAQDRLQKQLDEAKAQSARLQSDIWRRDAVAETGIPSILAERIQGATYDEMLADAKKLSEALPKQPKAPPLSPTNPGGGTQAETEAQKRERLFGRQGNIFDLGEIKQSGGGVVWKQKPD